jgi:hypothetical protein
VSKQSVTGERRPYRKRRRAQLEAEIRLRITVAAVDLHGSVGPARTTISAVGASMLERTTRDAALVPALRPSARDRAKSDGRKLVPTVGGERGQTLP